MPRRPLLFLVILIAMLVLTLRVGVPAAPAQEPTVANADIVVVRVQFTDPIAVIQYAAEHAVWEVNWERGEFVIDATPTQLRDLTERGFTYSLDEALTAGIRRVTEADPNQLDGIPGYPCYRTVEETYTSAADLAAAHPDLAQWSDVGDSWEKLNPGQGLPSNGYDMMVLRLTNFNLDPTDKPKLFITSAIHAREYTTAELATRFAEYLINSYGFDADATWLLDHHDIHFMLQANPDGRKQAETGLLWRKNTNNNYCSNTNSRGADLNRNFEFFWGCCGGSSGSECSETYRGLAAGSEPETQAVINYMTSIFPDQRGPALTDPAPADAMGVYLDLHSYSELVLWPWGFTATQAPNGVDLRTLGRKFAYFNDYEPMQSIGLYPTDGTTIDHVYGELGVAGFVFELGTAFFQSCTTFENTILPDNLAALIYAAKSASAPYLLPGGPEVLGLALSDNNINPGDPVTLSGTADDTRYSANNGTEPTHNIAAAEYYIDTPPWLPGAVAHPMSPSDGSFNTKTEGITAALDTGGLSNGQHTLFVRSQDIDGDWGVVSAIFLYVGGGPANPIIEGYVRDADTGAPLAATVTANGLYQADTDPLTGYYELVLPAGVYDLVASATGYSDGTANDISVNNGDVVQQDFDLTPDSSSCTAAYVLNDRGQFPDRNAAQALTDALYGVRDEVLPDSSLGQHYNELYATYRGRITYLLVREPELRATAGRLLRDLSDGVQALAAGETEGGPTLTWHDVTTFHRFLRQLAEVDRAYDGGELADVIHSEMARIDWHTLPGLSIPAAWSLLTDGATR